MRVTIPRAESPLTAKAGFFHKGVREGSFLEERQDGATLQLAADEHLASGINAVELEELTLQCRDRLS
jgi:hypothetical protein